MFYRMQSLFAILFLIQGGMTVSGVTRLQFERLFAVCSIFTPENDVFTSSLIVSVLLFNLKDSRYKKTKMHFVSVLNFFFLFDNYFHIKTASKLNEKMNNQTHYLKNIIRPVSSETQNVKFKLLALIQSHSNGQFVSLFKPCITIKQWIITIHCHVSLN